MKKLLMIAMVFTACARPAYLVQDWKVIDAYRNSDSTANIRLEKVGKPHPLPDSGLTGTYHSLVLVKTKR